MGSHCETKTETKMYVKFILKKVSLNKQRLIVVETTNVITLQPKMCGKNTLNVKVIFKKNKPSLENIV